MSLAVQFTEYGTPDVLRIVDVPPLTAGPGQVRLAVRAAGVNPIDWKILHGSMRQVMPVDLPGGLGSDVAGVVDQVGEGVTAFSVGDEVLGASITPSYAQSALADPAALVAKPASVPWEVAATLAGTGITAWEVLNKLKISTGETLLVHAAAGGVGTFAVQLAVARGARVIGTASERNHEQLRSFGVEPVTYGEGLVDRVRAISPTESTRFSTPPVAVKSRTRSNSPAVRHASSHSWPSAPRTPESRCTWPSRERGSRSAR